MLVPLPVDDIRRCSADVEFVGAVRRLYEELDRGIAAHNPVCVNRGECCRFTAYGHSLFVTSVELSFFLAVAGDPLPVPRGRERCPYQQSGRCTVRRARPIGCRVFFCDAAAQGWQPAATEETLVKLRAVGERFRLPYAYVEWTDALRRLRGGPVALPAAGGNRFFWAP